MPDDYADYAAFIEQAIREVIDYFNVMIPMTKPIDPDEFIAALRADYTGTASKETTE